MTLPDRWLSTSTDRLIADGVLEIGDGYRAKNAEFAEAGLPFARVQNIKGGFDFRNVDLYPEEALHRVGQKVSQCGDSVITTKGSVGRVAYVTDATPRFVYSPQLSYWRSLGHGVIRPRYLFYWLQGREFLEQCGQMKGSTDMADYLNLRDQRRLVITLPSTTEQDRIVGVLLAYDELIENNARRIQILEEMAKAIYREWFVEFRYPGHEDVPLVDSDLGPIPAGWEARTVGDLVTKHRQNVDPRKTPSECFAHFSIPAFDATHRPAIESGAEIKSLKYELPGPCVLYSKLNPRIPRVWLATPHPTVRSIASTEFLVLTPAADAPLSMIFALCSSPEFADRVVGMAGGTSTSHQRAKPGELLKLPIVAPPVELCATFDSLAHPLLVLAATLRTSSDNLRTTRDLLLPRLISGEIDVSELDIDVGDAAA